MTMPTEPAIYQLFDATRELLRVLRLMRPDRRRRILPSLLRRLVREVEGPETQAVVVRPGADGVKELADEFLGVLNQVLAEAEDLDAKLVVLDAASETLKKLDVKVYKELGALPV